MNEEQEDAAALAIASEMEANDLVDIVSKYQVTNITEAEQLATTIMRQVHDKEKFLEDKRKEIISPMRESIDAVNEMFKPAIDKVKQAKRILKDAIVEWMQEQIDNGEIPKIKGTRYTPTWKHEVIDAERVPREFLVVSDSLLASFAKKTKGAVSIAGVRFYETKDIAVDGKD